MDLSKADVLEAVQRQRARTLQLTRNLTPAEWETVVLPGWRVREVIAHLISTDEAALTGRMLPIMLKPSKDGGISAIEAWNEKQVKRWADRPVEDLLKGLETWGRRSIKIFSPLPSRVLSQRIPTGFGRVPMLFLGVLRTYDEYIHEQDLRRALDKDASPDPASTLAAARAMLDIAVTQTPSRMPDGASGRVVLRYDGTVLPVLLADLAAKTVTVEVDLIAEAVITCDPATILMVAAGRDRWRDAEAAGAIKIEGERDKAEIFLDALRAV